MKNFEKLDELLTDLEELIDVLHECEDYQMTYLLSGYNADESAAIEAKEVVNDIRRLLNINYKISAEAREEKKMNTIKNIKEAIKENGSFEILNDMVLAVNVELGGLDEYYYLENDEYQIGSLFDGKAYELAKKIQWGNYNANHEYFRFDSYENLESITNFDLEKKLNDNITEIVEEYIEYRADGGRDNLNDDEVNELIEEYINNMEQ